MTEKEFQQALDVRRKTLKMSYRDIQRQTGLGYNTVRRIFKDPMNSGIFSVIKVARLLKCKLTLVITDGAGDSIKIPS